MCAGFREIVIRRMVLFSTADNGLWYIERDSVHLVLSMLLFDPGRKYTLYRWRPAVENNRFFQHFELHDLAIARSLVWKERAVFFYLTFCKRSILSFHQLSHESIKSQLIKIILHSLFIWNLIFSLFIKTKKIMKKLYLKYLPAFIIKLTIDELIII